MSKKNKKTPTRMKMRLKDLGLSQTELARRVNKNVSLINHFCIHGVKTVRVAKEYAKILCCRPEELLDL
ncbi:MAG: helix-turn-helix transcriptional regulator [Lentisphaeria bacterium]|nr:helix-turn-helix transcriptional regulator [Lentisphaeria bacterium]